MIASITVKLVISDDENSNNTTVNIGYLEVMAKHVQDRTWVVTVTSFCVRVNIARFIRLRDIQV